MPIADAVDSKLYCTVCEVFVGSKSNYALHAISMEHCENLLRVGKPKLEPESTKYEGTSSDMVISEATSVTVEHSNTTPIPPYGCIVPAKLDSTNEEPKDIDYTKYDHYCQSLAEIPSNGQVVPMSEDKYTNSTTVSSSCKTITKSLISCEVCNVILTTIPDYESHIKNPQHIWNMKLRGRGVTAHFIKTNADSDNTNIVKLSTDTDKVKQNDLGEPTPACEKLTLIPFPLLYCDACELLLNNPQQFNTHVNGDSHNLCVQKKGKMKVKAVQFPLPDKHYCYSCKLILNSVSQYNHHKTGRKHKNKCTQLVRIGITIPLDEQLPEWDLPEIDPEQPVKYPEFYEKFVLGKLRELEEFGDVKQLLMNESDCESNDCITILDTTTSKYTSENVEDLQNFKSEATPPHIYRIQNKKTDLFPALPLKIDEINYSTNS